MKKIFIFSFLFKFISVCTSFGVTILLARNLSISDFGLVALATSLLTLLALPSQAGISQFVVRNVAKSLSVKKVLGLGSLRKKSLVFSVFSSSLITGLTIFVLHSYYAKHDSIMLLLSFLVLPLHAISLLNCAFIRGMDHVIASQIPELLVRNTTNFIALYGYTVIFSQPLKIDVVVQALIYSHIIALLVSMCIFYKSKNRIKNKNDVEIFYWRNFKKIIPLTMISAVYLINTQYDILVISYYLPPSDVGVYKATVQLSVLMTVSLTIIQQIYQPKIVNLIATARLVELQNLMQTTSFVLFSFSIVLFVIYLFFGEFVLKQVFGLAFKNGYWCLIILSAGQLLNAYFGPLGTVLNMAEKERLVLKSAIVSLLINVTLSTFLVAIYGMIGAAIGTMISLIAFNLALYAAVTRSVGIRPLLHEKF